MRNIRNTITPALVLDKHMIPCRDENEKRLLYAYLSKKRELAEHLSQIIYVLHDIQKRDEFTAGVVGTVNTVGDSNKTDTLFTEEYLGIKPYLKVIPPDTAHIFYYNCSNVAVFNPA